MMTTTIDTDSVKTEKLDFRNIDQCRGETIEEMKLFVDPFGIEIRTNKATYQIYKDGLKTVAERTTFKSFKMESDTPWCDYPERSDCKGCDMSLAPELSDGGCKNLVNRGDSV